MFAFTSARLNLRVLILIIISFIYTDNNSNILKIQTFHMPYFTGKMLFLWNTQSLNTWYYSCLIKFNVWLSYFLIIQNYCQ